MKTDSAASSYLSHIGRKGGVIYSGDNGELICLKCAGQSAKFTGRDTSGQRVMRCAISETVAWRAEFGVDMSCEEGCTTYPQPK